MVQGRDASMDFKEHLILYVDDEYANRVVFEQTFGKKFRVKCVSSGDEALDVIGKESVAVLVTDQRMPGMSGDELLTRAKVLSPDTLRIVITAYSDVDPILRAVNEGLVVRYIVKPWDRTELDEILSWAVEAYAVGRQDSALQLRLIETERLLTLGHFSASILHDLNQPLQSLNTYFDVLAPSAEAARVTAAKIARGEEIPLSEAAALHDSLSEIVAAGDDARIGVTFIINVLRQLKSFQTMGAIPTTERREADPGEVVRMALILCRQSSVAAHATMAYDGPTDLPRIGATPTELLQVLLNLLRNALQALKDAGGGGHVVVHTAELESHVRFTIRDTGPGIPADALAKVGRKFYSTRSGGTGLGVAQCLRIVGALGGKLDIDSAVGRGTTVTFTVPKLPRA